MNSRHSDSGGIRLYAETFGDPQSCRVEAGERVCHHMPLEGARCLD